MKKLVLATAVAALTATSANAAPTVYGKAAVGFNIDTYEAKGKDNDASMKDFSSRFGIKGSEDLAGGVKGIYKFEYGLKVDQKNDKEFSAKKRDAYLGLASDDLGTLKLGYNTAVDDGIAYSQTVGLGADNILDLSFDANRTNNSVVYESPNFSGLQVKGMYGLDEDLEKGDEETAGGALIFDNDMIKVGASVIAQGESVMHYRGSAGVSLSGFDLGVTYVQDDVDGKDDNQANLQLGAAANLGMFEIAGQYDMLTDKGGNKGDDYDRYAGSLTYKLSKRTKSVTYVSLLDQKGDNNNVTSFGTGIIHKF